MGEKWIEEIRERREKATALADQITVRVRYDHGGGRMYIQMPGEGRNLIGDFYNEGDREFYFYALADIGHLLDERERVETMLDPDSLFDGLEDAAAHRMQAYITEQSNVQDLEREVERLRAENAEVWEQAVKIAENPNNIRMVGGSTGDAYGTSKLVAAALRSRQTDAETNGNKCKHNVDLSAICEMCDYETADEGE